jgi:hypothetical protein
MSELPSDRVRGVAPDHSLARTLAVVLGAPLAAAALSAALVRLLPVPLSWASAIGFHALVPLWIGWVCFLPLSRSGARAWLFCALACLPLLASLLVRGWGSAS